MSEPALTPQKWTHRIKNRPVAPRATSLSQKRTRCVENGAITPKMDLLPPEQPRCLKSGPDVSKTNLVCLLPQIRPRHLKGRPDMVKTDLPPPKWACCLKVDPVTSKPTPPSRNQTRCVENGPVTLHGQCTLFLL
ncbi:hypothetical protein PAXRUDRAFT_19770 [Paxillus rubicundulus Ve08.2h10]|uniref:Unplaced genomic scaffold scaffold_3946, whole genome shotgun sequence n=1 Tax=Paxillus rubicundulus Ve08.2h10 TaxID=930991 RepID=A0A0D0D3M5_9AGAM|nr:hypothetical protein PAXRUDRAFT_19770 [Paxillus rubicundulus Ve08.2h10]